MNSSWKSAIAREWIIFALSLGLGAHIMLGFMLHAPERWPWHELGLYGVLIGLSVYVIVQVVRSCWWVIGPRFRRTDEDAEGS
jgi:hypothetical protein